MPAPPDLLRMPGWVTALILCLASSAAAASPTYRWVDAQGQVHYSQTPPEQGTYSKYEPRAPGAHPAPAVESIDDFVESSETDELARAAAEHARQVARNERQQQCQAARDRLAYLDEKTARRLMRVDDNGERVRFTEDMFNAERDKALEQIANSCE
ncbi:MAG: DUF4124 domain-containing protein [Gammaproteobacteria bacterium]|nr:DUF4124 domain-containing protein [Gammaproteobacteria bacterium]